MSTRSESRARGRDGGEEGALAQQDRGASLLGGADSLSERGPAEKDEAGSQHVDESQCTEAELDRSPGTPLSTPAPPPSASVGNRLPPTAHPEREILPNASLLLCSFSIDSNS